MKIKEATRADVSIIHALIYELAVYEKMEDQMIATQEGLENALFDKQEATVILGEVDQEVVGFALFFNTFSTFLGQKNLYLEDLYIKAPYRNRGYGKQFFKYLVSYAIKTQCKRLEWVCLNWNEPSIQFYCKLGAQPLSEWTTYRLDEEALKAFDQQI